MDVITKHWIVTFAKAIRYPTRSGRRKVYGVIGFDIFIWKLAEYLSIVIERCNDFCSLANPLGYMIYHPKMLTDNEDLKSHITQFEPELSGHFVNIGLLEKSACRYFEEGGLKDSEFYSFSSSVLSPSTSDQDNAEYLIDTNVIVVVKESYREDVRCESLNDKKCRDVPCHSPCTKPIKVSCQPRRWTANNLTLPCRSARWWTYGRTPDALDGLEKCYEHFEEPRKEEISLAWISGAVQGAVGIAIAFWAGTTVYAKKHATRTGSSPGDPTHNPLPNTADVPNSQFPNMGSPGTYAPGLQNTTDMNSPFNQCGNFANQGPPQVTSVNQWPQGFAQQPPPPSYEASSQAQYKSF